MNTIFITGTSSGIGKATAKLFAEKGWTVIATMRRPEKEAELNQYKNIKIYPLDITKPEQITETISAVLEKYDVAEEAAQDAYTAVTDGDKDRMCYVTGKRAKELYAKRQELGAEKFRQYVRATLMGEK